MGDLVAFLAACVDEDEAIARAAPGVAFQAQGLHWSADGGSVRDEYGLAVVFDVGAPTGPQAQHIARHDPARALREVAAKRAILLHHGREHDCPVTVPVSDPGRISDGCYISTEHVDEEHGPCTTLRALGAVYSDRPGYDPAWAPESASGEVGHH